MPSGRMAVIGDIPRSALAAISFCKGGGWQELRQSETLPTVCFDDLHTDLAHAQCVASAGAGASEINLPQHAVGGDLYHGRALHDGLCGALRLCERLVAIVGLPCGRGRRLRAPVLARGLRARGAGRARGAARGTTPWAGATHGNSGWSGMPLGHRASP